MAHCFLTSEQQKEISILIDWYSWKHSWHLPKNEYGYVDWHSDESIEKCREILEGYRDNSIELANRFRKYADVLKQVQKARKEDADG